jgi:hypothetical protein
MKLDKFRAELENEAHAKDELYSDFHSSIVNDSFTDASEIWGNDLFVKCSPSPENSAKIIFPDEINLLTASIFYDRVYVHIEES